MRLNIPGVEALLACKNLLIAGMGGGFDVYRGLPIYLELLSLGARPHLASLSFSPFLRRISAERRLTPTLAGVTAEYPGKTIYFPELDLARWFRERRSEEVTVWAFEKSGGQVMRDDYRALAEHLELDGILLVDGGVDSLKQGDEARIGTAIEDALTLSAVHQLTEIPLRQIACIGFGVEREVTHAHVLQNIAALTAAGAWLGSCALAPGMDSYRGYEDAVRWVNELPFQDPSVINASIVSAAQGHFGNYHLTQKTAGSTLWINPLMSLYWFFELDAVAERNLFVSQLQTTQTPREALYVMSEIRRGLKPRSAQQIPLP
jgi:hypothetical protein